MPFGKCVLFAVYIIIVCIYLWVYVSLCLLYICNCVFIYIYCQLLSYVHWILDINYYYIVLTYIMIMPLYYTNSFFQFQCDFSLIPEGFLSYVIGIWDGLREGFLYTHANSLLCLTPCRLHLHPPLPTLAFGSLIPASVWS